VSLVSSERVAMVVPASAPEPSSGATTGYSFALLDAQGRVLYRRPLHAPVRIDAEAFAPGRPIERVPATSSEGRFTLLVPDVADARTFRLSGPSDPRRTQDPATELLRLDVDALRKQSGAGQPTPPSPARGRKG
jgi:hypothetical protein